MKNAVIQSGGKQYIVSEGDKLEVERIDAEPGSKITIDKVLMVRTDSEIKIGTPIVEGAKVVAEVIGHKRAPKVIAFKMIRREGYRRKKGHRQHLTVLRVDKIEV